VDAAGWAKGDTSSTRLPLWTAPVRHGRGDGDRHGDGDGDGSGAAPIERFWRSLGLGYDEDEVAALRQRAAARSARRSQRRAILSRWPFLPNVLLAAWDTLASTLDRRQLQAAVAATADGRDHAHISPDGLYKVFDSDARPIILVQRGGPADPPIPT
jgi:hypothetical protein